MFKNILIVDDEKDQAEGMSQWLQQDLGSQYCLTSAYEKEDIEYKIDDGFYSLVFLDLRFDGYGFDGVNLAERVIKNNPFAKIVFISSFTSDFYEQTKELLLSGRILDIQEKSDVKTWYPKLSQLISSYYEDFNKDISELNKSLLNQYSNVKNESDNYRKGVIFEDFMALLFGLMGFNHIMKRVKDVSQNEVDLIIRNDVDDLFINKFSKYIFVECKNYPDKNIGKNEFIIFNNKLNNTNGLANFGVFATTKAMSNTAYLEALRESKGNSKIVFLDNNKIIELIQSDNKIEYFKKIIDEQVKDN